MSQHLVSPSHEELTRSLEADQVPFSAAHVHGMICAALCRAMAVSWKGLLTDEVDHEGSGLLHQLEALYQSTSDQLYVGLYDFSLLLPDEDAPVNVRSSALGDWCRGYLLVLLKQDVLPTEQFSGDVLEIVNDIISIAKLDEEPEEDESTQEKELFEIEEYLRTGIQLIFENLQSPGEQRVLH